MHVPCGFFFFFFKYSVVDQLCDSRCLQSVAGLWSLKIRINHSSPCLRTEQGSVSCQNWYLLWGEFIPENRWQTIFITLAAPLDGTGKIRKLIKWLHPSILWKTYLVFFFCFTFIHVHYEQVFYWLSPPSHLTLLEEKLEWGFSGRKHLFLLRASPDS